MNKKQWYETLFENYSEQYDKEIYTQGTSGECDFIEKELNYDKSFKILDVGCGTGRHTIELSKRGYLVTGVDLSENQLKKAREKAEMNKLNIKFLLQDARTMTFDQEFDVAIMLCEGGFPLMETDEMNYAILKNVTKSLKANGKFIFTTLNGLFPLYHSVEKFCASGTGSATYRSCSFDLMTFRDHNTTEIVNDSGEKITLECNERYYVPSEITWLLKTLHYKKTDIFGTKLGKYSRNDPLTTEDFEMLVITEKQDT